MPAAGSTPTLMFADVRSLLFFLVWTASPLALGANVGVQTAVQQSRWNGFDRLDLTIAGRPAILVLPATAAAEGPWIWRTEFFGHEPQVDLALLQRGWHVAYIDAKNMYGGPKAMALPRSCVRTAGWSPGLSDRSPRVALAAALHASVTRQWPRAEFTSFAHTRDGADRRQDGR